MKFTMRRVLWRGRTMATSDAAPITEEVCTQTEIRVIGYRNLTDDE